MPASMRALIAMLTALVWAGSPALAEGERDVRLQQMRHNHWMAANDTFRSGVADLRRAIEEKRQSLKIDGADSYRYLSTIARIALINADRRNLAMADRGSAHALARLETLPPSAAASDEDHGYWRLYIRLTRAYVLMEMGRLQEAAESYKAILGEPEFMVEIRKLVSLAEQILAKPEANKKTIEIGGNVFELADNDRTVVFALIDVLDRHGTSLIRLYGVSPAYQAIVTEIYESFAPELWPLLQSKVLSKLSKQASDHFTAVAANMTDLKPDQLTEEAVLPIINLIAKSLLERVKNSTFFEMPFSRSAILAELLAYGGHLLAVRGRCPEAEKVYEAAAYVARGRHSRRMRTEHALCMIERGRHADAFKFLSEGTRHIVEATARDALEVDSGHRNFAEREEADRMAFAMMVAGWTLNAQKPDRQILESVFKASQLLGRTSAGLALDQAAVRRASASAEPMRKAQDLAEAWRRTDGEIIAIGFDRSQLDRRERLSRTLVEINEQLIGLRKQILENDPQYEHLMPMQMLTLSELQQLLSSDEALVVFSIVPSPSLKPQVSFVWAITRGEVRWKMIRRGQAWIRQAVEELRCGIDQSAAVSARCIELTARQFTSGDAARGKLPIFNADQAFQLYRELFGEISDVIDGKRLRIVTSGALDQMPFQALVRSKPATDALDKIDWLGLRQSIAMLPSVGSLKSLRAVSVSSNASRPFLGIGNPQLRGGDAVRVKAAAERQSCQLLPELPRVELAKMRTGVTPIADTAVVASLEALPETADELCDVASALGATRDAVLLGRLATETRLKDLDASGGLKDYRILHFATHGTMAGELRPGLEPGLIMTPPVAGTVTDDGYLAASEILGLKIDADIVVLSACNTASGSERGMEALSGLARSFFFAGARSLVVSHWYVESDAAVRIISDTVKGSSGPDATSAVDDSLRRAITGVVSQGGRHAHPAVWAPFVVVGAAR